MIKQITTLLLISLSFFSFGQSNINSKAAEALSYCKENKFDTTFCILIDMNIHSGKNRFFIWDFTKQKKNLTGLVSHGCCQLPWGEDQSASTPKFNNIPDSHCSSLGKYKIGKRGYSNWGIHINYKMHGLDRTNNKAYARLIVLHSWEEVSEAETYPTGTPEGWGCPAVSNKMMAAIDKKLVSTSQPVLMWIYQ